MNFLLNPLIKAKDKALREVLEKEGIMERDKQTRIITGIIEEMIKK